MEMNLTEVKDFFTDEEWDAIDCALSDYQDYGEEESILSDTIKSKIHKLFNWSWHFPKSNLHSLSTTTVRRSLRIWI